MGFLDPRFHKKFQRVVLALENLLDVLLTSPSGGDFLQYNGTKWVNTKALGTPISGNLANCTGYTYTNLAGTIPTWNQNTTGTAAAWTTSRNLAGNSVNGSANVAFANKFVVQGTVDTGLSGAQFLGALATGIVKNTTTTGVLSIAINSDLPAMSATVGGAVPTPPNNTTTFLRGDGSWASVGGASGGTVTNTAGALTASALVVGNAASDVKVLASLGTTAQVLKGNAAGLPSWGTVAYSEISGTVPTWNQNTTGSSASCTGNALTATIVSGSQQICGYAGSALTIAYIGAGGPQLGYGVGGGASMCSFHRPGAFAVNFGLDADNVLKVGGWSMGAVAYAVYHAGNPQPSVAGSSGSCSGNANTATSAANLSGTPTVPNGTAATTQTYGDDTTKLATTAFVDRLRDVPASTSTTLVISDRGKSVDGTANISIPTNASVNFPVGATISFTNTGSSTLTIAAVTPGTTTLRLAGTTTTGTRTLAAYGMATMRQAATDVWHISGAGLT